MRRFIAMLLLLALPLVAEDKPRVWVHAPVEDLLALFPDKGAGFLISIEEFEKLRTLARNNRAVTESRAPVDARLVRGGGTAKLVEDRLVVETTYTVVSKAPGATEIAFPVANIALLTVDTPEHVSYGGGMLRIEKPGNYEVKARLACLARADTNGVRRTAFSLPPAAAHSLTLALPPQTEGEVGPIARAFRAGDAGGTVTGYPDRRGLFRVWMRPRTRAQKLEPIVSTTFGVMASVGETRTLASTQLEIRIERAPRTSLTLELPRRQLVHALTGKQVKSWRLVRAEPRDRLEITLVQPFEGTLKLGLETELPRENPARARLPFPVVSDAVRYRGTVGLVKRPEVRLTGLRATGARRLDKLPKQGLALYEVYDPAARIEVDVEAIASETGAETIALLALSEGGKALHIRTTYRIAGKPLFRLVPQLPAGWTLRGNVFMNGSPIPHRLLEDGRLVIDLPNGLQPGTHNLQVSLDTNEVDWVAENGVATYAWRGFASGLDEEKGRLAVAADPSFRVSVDGEQGVRSIGLNELGLAQNDKMLFAWSYENTRPRIDLSVRRHEPQLTAKVIQQVRPAEKSLKMHATVLLRIERAGISELKVELPKGTGEPVDFQGKLIKERRKPADDAETDTWTLVFQRRIRGTYKLDVRFDRTFEEDNWSATVPAVRVPEASESGFVVVQSTANTAVKVERGGLRQADVAELPYTPLQSPLEVLSYSQHPFSVTIGSKRHDSHPVVQAIALSAHIYGVVSPDGRLRCRAEYRVRNNDQAFLHCALPKTSRLIGATVDGNPVKPLLAEGWLKLPLERSRDRTTPVVVALVYESEIEELGTRARLKIRRPALRIDVLKTSYSLHLPEGYEVSGHEGDMVPLEQREKETVAEVLAETFGRSMPGAALVASAAGAPKSGTEALDRADLVTPEDITITFSNSLDPDAVRETPRGPTSPAPAAGKARDRAKYELENRKWANEVENRAQLEVRIRDLDTRARELQQSLAAGIREIQANQKLTKKDDKVYQALRDAIEEKSRLDEEIKALERIKRSYTADPSRKQAIIDAQKIDLSKLRESVESANAKLDSLRTRRNFEPQSESAPDDSVAADKRPAPPAPNERARGTRRRAGEKKLRETTREEPEEDADVDAEDSFAYDRKGKPGGGGRLIAKGGRDESTPALEPKPKEASRAQPERALLSLDVQFWKPDNVVRLESLAPTGEVTLRVTRREVFDTRHYLGFVIGLAFGIVMLLAPAVSLLRVLPVAALLIAALHFAGLSFLSNDFAIGAGLALGLVIVLALLVRIPRLLAWMWRMLRKIRWPRKPAAGATTLLLAAGLASAQDAEEIIAPYKGDATEKIDRVFLPAKQYHELRKLAFPTTGARRTIVADARYTARRTGDDVVVEARYRIEKETDAVERIPLRLQEVAVTKATLNEKPATLAVDAKRGYLLVLQGAGSYELVLELRPRLRRNGKASFFSLPVRPVATATCTIEHDVAETELSVGALGGVEEKTYRLGPVATLQATWTPKTKGFETVEAELRSETYLQCSIRDGFTAVAGRVRYTIAGGTISRVQVAVDPSLTVRHVRSANLAGWNRTADGTLQIALSKPAARSHTIEVWAERKQARLRNESVPRFEPLGVVRDTGTITLETLPDLKLELTKIQGLLRGTLPRRAPKFRATPEWRTTHSVHRYAVRPFALDWKVALEPTRLRSKSETYVYLAPEEVRCTVMLHAETERGPGEFLLRVGVPPDFEVTGVQGPQLRDWWVEEGRLHIARLARTPRTASYRIDLRRRATTADGIQVPALALLDAVRQTGEVQIRVADGLEVETGDGEGLLPVNLDRLRQPGTDRSLVRAYQYVAVPWSLTVSTREERREMDALTVTRVVPLADSVRFESLINFHVRSGLVDTVRFFVPVTDEKEIVLVAPEMREETSVEVDGGRLYTLSLRNPTRGSIAATVSFHRPHNEATRSVEPRDVSQLRRYVIVEKIADGAVRIPVSEGLEKIDFGEIPIVPPGARAANAAASYVGSGDAYAVGVGVKTYEFDEVADVLVYSAAAQIVVDRTGWTRALVSYRVYNRSRQFLELSLPEGATLYSALVQGEGVRPLQRQGRVLVPLRKVAIGATTFNVDVIYSYATKRIDRRDWTARLPDVGGVDVRRTTVSLYLPRGFRYGFDTKMDEVDPADLALGQSTDLFEEIKELYGVAQRGNAIQAARALDNVAQLEREVQRFNEEIQTQSKDVRKVQQLEAQTRALESLRRQNKPAAKGDAAGRAADFNDTTAIFGRLGQARSQTVEEWRLNPQYLEDNRLADNEDLAEFKAANIRGRGGSVQDSYGQNQTITLDPSNFRGPNGGVPPGNRQPNDPAPPVTQTADAQGLAVLGTLFVDEGIEIAQLDDVTSGLDDNADAAIFNRGPAVDTGGLSTSLYDPNFAEGSPLKVLEAFGKNMRQASGRRSLRIELPRDGEVFHFATSGSTIELEVDANERGGAIGKGFLALALFGAAAFLLRVGRK
ncbi:MAG: hypothetical protein AAGD14_03485 [Planctomycetota bacterium]